MQIFAALEAVFEKMDLKPKVPPARTNYDLGKDPAKLHQEMTEMGFIKIRIWYQQMNFNFKDADAYVDHILEAPSAKGTMMKLTPDLAEIVRKDLKDEYNKKMGPDVLDPKQFELMIITAEKPWNNYTFSD